MFIMKVKYFWNLVNSDRFLIHRQVLDTYLTNAIAQHSVVVNNTGILDTCNDQNQI